MILQEPPAYHREIVEYLRKHEAGLWKWFSSQKFLAEYADRVRLDLLKRAYRLERDAHAGIYAAVDELLPVLGLACPVTVYQAQGAAGMNASLSYLPGEVHLVLSGPLTATLSAAELRSVFAHELSHHVLRSLSDGEFLVAEELLSAMEADSRAEPSHVETARLFRLYAEIFADRGSLMALGDPLVTVSALVKMETGLAEVSAENYLRQAGEILSKGAEGARAGTHPETYLRARAVQLWAEDPARAPAEIARLVEGRRPLGQLDLLGQMRWTRVTRALIQRLLAPRWMQTPAMSAHARLFFEDLSPGEDGEVPAVADADPTLRDYVCYVLLDFARADPDLEDGPLAAAFVPASELGLADRLEEPAARELGMKKKHLYAVREQAPRTMQEASRARGG